MFARGTCASWSSPPPPPPPPTVQGSVISQVAGRIQGEGYYIRAKASSPPPPPPPPLKNNLAHVWDHCQIEAWIVKQGDEEQLQCLLSTQEAVSGCGGFFLELEVVFHGHQVRSISQAQPPPFFCSGSAPELTRHLYGSTRVCCARWYLYNLAIHNCERSEPVFFCMFMSIGIHGLCAGILKFRLILNVVPTSMRMLGNNELKSKLLAPSPLNSPHPLL